MRPPVSPRPQVAPSSHCGRPAERPFVAAGRVVGRDREHLPLCGDCLPLLLEDVRAFRDGMGRG
jgi:hypothetical protein